jgi:probable HAF family extracellular repeat protein
MNVPPKPLRARTAAVVIAIGAASLLIMNAANAEVRNPAYTRIDSHDRIFAAAHKPRHIATFGVRTDLRGDTPLSTKYFKITNLSGEVGGSGGYASAVNNDDRVVYNDFGDGDEQMPPPYIINNGGSYGALPFPTVACDAPISSALGLNQAGEAVGNWGCEDQYFRFQGYAGWALSGATASKLAYYDQRYKYSSDGSYAASVNDRDVAVGCDGGCLDTGSGVAALFEQAKSSHGTVHDLLGLKGKQCYASATSINDAGQIVGFACNKAVRFSPNGYAEPLVTNEPASSAQAINARGDIVGYLSRGAAFLYRLGKVAVLPLPPGDGGFSQYAYAVNATDEVVGSLEGPNNTYSAFVYLNGRSYDLNTLIPPNSGWTIADANGVNDHGEIVGDGYYGGTLYGISLKPPI